MSKVIASGLTADRTFTFPDANGIILTANTAIAVTSATIPAGNRYGFSGNSGGLGSNGTVTQLLAPDGGAYVSSGNGVLNINSASVAMQSAGSTKWSWSAVTVDGQLVFTDSTGGNGVGFDITTDTVLKIRTRAQTGYARVDAVGYSTSGVAGVTTFGPAAVTSITVKGGIITAIS